MITELPEMYCKRCKLSMNTFQVDYKLGSCEDKKCHLRTHKGRKALALAFDREPEDFIKAETGKIELYKEPEPTRWYSGFNNRRYMGRGYEGFDGAFRRQFCDYD